MPHIEPKKVIVDEIKEKLVKATSAVLVDGRGLTVEEDTRLRKTLREAGVDYKVYKNSMMNFAIKDTPFEGLEKFLEGPSTLAICYEDPTLAARLIKKESKTIKALEFKAGVLDNVVYDAKGMDLVADIPSREELLSKLLGSFKSPLASFARVINAIAENGGQTAEPAATEVVAEPVVEPVAVEEPVAVAETVEE